MIIKINDFGPVRYSTRAEIVSLYLDKFEKTTWKGDGFLATPNPHSTIETTGKHPVKITRGRSNYHVKCKKTSTMYVFDIWLAV